MRLFTGLSIAYEVRRNLELMLEHWKPLAALRWSPPANFHITTKFIGEWPDDRLPELTVALGEIAPRGAERIAIRGLGWMPNPHHPHALYAGVQPLDRADSLAELHTAVDKRLSAIGVAPEKRSYTPHVTLARVPRGEADLAPLRRAIATLPSADFGVMTAAKHLLYRSKTGPDGSAYSVIAEFPL